MPRSDGLASLASDLRNLSTRERRWVFDALTPFERTQVTILLEQEDERGKTQKRPNQTSLFSSWLAKRLQDVDEKAGRGATTTAATRELLARLAREASSADAPLDLTETIPGPPKSLLGAMGNFFMAGPR